MRQLQQLAAPRFAHDGAGGIVHGRNGVDVFRPHAAAREVVERRGQGIHAHAPAVERNAHGIDAEPGQARECALIGFLLDQHGIAARQQHAIDEVDGLQRARGDQNLVGRTGHAGGAPKFGGQELAQRPVALRPACKSIGRKRGAFTLEHRNGSRDQAIDRHLVGIVVPAGEIVAGKSSPSGSRRRQPGGQYGGEVESCGSHAAARPNWLYSARENRLMRSMPRPEKSFVFAVAMLILSRKAIAAI